MAGVARHIAAKIPEPFDLPLLSKELGGANTDPGGAAAGAGPLEMRVLDADEWQL